MTRILGMQAFTFFAIGSLESALTLTLVGIHPCVFAGSSVLAWFLVTRIYCRKRESSQLLLISNSVFS